MVNKNPKIPISTINIFEVTSAATYLFCASTERRALPGTQFLFHAAAVGVPQTSLKPDEVLQLKRSLDLIHRFDDLAYKQCMNIDDEELRKLTESEYFRRHIDEIEAEKIGLISDVITQVEPSKFNFYILDDDKVDK